jgi:3-deoxy-D-manno-octulosonic-acid transferase
MILYTIVVTLILIPLYPLAFVGNLLGFKTIWQHLFLPPSIRSQGEKRVWIHAASVGESAIAFFMAGEVKKKYPHASLVISTMTVTGLSRIHRLMNETKNIVDSAFLSPFDHPLVISSFIKKLRPTTCILVEAELWPWLITSMHRARIPTILINGKLSRRGFRRYMTFHSLFKRIMENISLACVQSRTYARRFKVLGIPEERIETLGNVKFDNLPEPSDFNRITLRRLFGLPETVNVFVAGSTRPGEEELLGKAFHLVLKHFPQAVMIVAPRHLNRVPEVIKTFENQGHVWTTRSSKDRLTDTGKNILILDTMGELISAYACADTAFVGGSLRDFGGHNPLEPSALGVPVLFGHYMEQTGSKELLSGGAALLVHNDEEIAHAIIMIWETPETLHHMAEAGPRIVKRFRGTLASTLGCIENRHLI